MNPPATLEIGSTAVHHTILMQAKSSKPHCFASQQHQD